MSTFSKYLSTICATTFTGVFFLRIFHYTFIFAEPSQILLGCIPTLAITSLLIAICSFVQHPLLTKFDKIIKRGCNNPETITEKDRTLCLKAFKNYDVVIIVAHIVGFLIGAGSTTIIEAVKGIVPFNIITFTLIELQSVGVGFMCYTINNVLVKRIHMANMMRQIGIELSDNLTKVQNVAVSSSVYVAVMNMLCVPYHLLKFPQDNGFGLFIPYGILGAVMSMLAFFAIYILIAKKIQNFEKNISNNLLLETKNLADATKHSAENSQNQSAAVKEIVATMHDSTELANNIGEKIKEVTKLAELSRDAVVSGNTALQHNVQELLDIKNTNMLTIEGIKQLNTKINGIWDIVSIINNVADQTKIIAFNAELEASSSGEAGKNFHIVATEIRRLSDNIIDSIKEIREIISEIQKASDTLILDSEKGSSQIDEGCESARSLENGFDSILQSSKATADSSHEILENVGQLTGASEQIFIALQQIAHGIESFTQSTENISTASENVKQIASRL